VRQELGNITAWERSGGGLPFPGDGLIGFLNQPSSLGDNATTWFTKLCDSKLIDQCRFGIALRTDCTGEQFFGSVEHAVFDNELTVAPILLPWAVAVDLAFNGEIIFADAAILIDSGTSVILG